jgi:hypothetical protein
MTKKSGAQLEREIATSLRAPGSPPIAPRTPARLSKTTRMKLGAALRREVKNEKLLAGGRWLRHDDYERAAENAIKACGLYGRAAAQPSDDGVEIFEIVDGEPFVDYGAMVRWYEGD